MAFPRGGSSSTVSRSNWNLEVLVFDERENRSTRRKTSRSRVENQQQTQPTYDAGSENRTRDTLVGGERSHHCANPADAVNTQSALLEMSSQVSFTRIAVLNNLGGTNNNHHRP